MTHQSPRTPSCAPDTDGWEVVVKAENVVQVSTPCLCGSLECWWHAPVYRAEGHSLGWYQ